MDNSAALRTAFAVSILLAAGAILIAALYSPAGHPADCGASCLSIRFDSRVDRAYGEPGSGASGADGASSSCVGQCSGSSGAGSAGTDGESRPGGSVKGTPGSDGSSGTSGSDGAPGTAGSDGSPGTSGSDVSPGTSDGHSQPEAAGAQEVVPQGDTPGASAPPTPTPAGQESAPEPDAGCTGLGSLLNLLGLGSLLNLC